MKTFEIKLSGSGTLEELSTHLLQLSQALSMHQNSDHFSNWEDPYISAEITEE